MLKNHRNREGFCFNIHKGTVTLVKFHRQNKIVKNIVIHEALMARSSHFCLSAWQMHVTNLNMREICETITQNLNARIPIESEESRAD